MDALLDSDWAALLRDPKGGAAAAAALDVYGRCGCGGRNWLCTGETPLAVYGRWGYGARHELGQGDWGLRLADRRA